MKALRHRQRQAALPVPAAEEDTELPGPAGLGSEQGGRTPDRNIPGSLPLSFLPAHPRPGDMGTWPVGAPRRAEERTQAPGEGRDLPGSSCLYWNRGCRKLPGVPGGRMRQPVSWFLACSVPGGSASPNRRLGVLSNRS